MKRIIIVYNPRSSKQLKIEKEVIRPLSGLGGYQIGKYAVKKASVDENASQLSKLLIDGDLVISAGGDGTSTMALNAVMESEKDVTLGVLGYGNFNDFSRMLGEKKVDDLIADYESGEIVRMFPLEAILDGQHWRYAACYFTVGMFAESTEVFNAPKTRRSLKKGGRKLIYSVLMLARWYFKNRKNNFLPKDIQLGDVALNKMKIAKSGRENIIKTPAKKWVSDVMMVNSRSVAKIMKVKGCWQSPNEVFVSYGRLKGFWRLVWFMMRSIVSHLPGKKYVDREVKIDFSGPEEFELQAEGEYARVKAKELIVRKDGRGVKVVCR